ncbi:MAG: UDP-N-acetylmuramoyl-tripeptide--D-alanyl-D-alanine ligase [Candidatus Omnitrophica bacterium]|nr:UDP-N-acetylmuramoyl-tripeptide--D-alanyl-D-alanine ligase [Candidatus Omnitrophota bacterium]
MFGISLKEILKATEARVVCEGIAKTFSGISTDTRSLKAGDLFIALKGKNFNGHDFAGEAFRKGAAGVLVECQIPKYQLRTVLCVDDTLKAFGDIAHYHRMKFEIPFIGVTGSSGKTTAKEMIYEVLNSQFHVLKNQGTENNLVGLPQTLLRLDSQHDIAVVELGTNHFGEIKRLADILKPTVGIIINIGPSHLEFLKSEIGVFKEKTELLKNLDKNGTAIINADDKLLSKIKRLNCKTIIRFGIGKTADFRATKIFQEKGMIKFIVNDKYDFRINLLGRHNIYNALAAISVGFLHGVSYDNIYKAFLKFQPVEGRLCLKKIGPITVIDDTYNSNPPSITAALSVLSECKTGGRKIFVCGDMLELGKTTIRFHTEAGKVISRMGVDYLICVGEFANIIRNAAIFGGMKKDVIFCCKDNTVVLKILKEILKDGDVLLLKGSRRIKLDEVLDALSSFISPKRDMVRV